MESDDVFIRRMIDKKAEEIYEEVQKNEKEDTRNFRRTILKVMEILRSVPFTDDELHRFRCLFPTVKDLLSNPRYLMYIVLIGSVGLIEGKDAFDDPCMQDLWQENGKKMMKTVFGFEMEEEESDTKEEGDGEAQKKK